MLGRFGLEVWFGRVNEDDLKRPQVNVANAKLELQLHLGTIPVRSGPIVIIRLSQFNCNCNYLLELSLAIIKSKSSIQIKLIISS